MKFSRPQLCQEVAALPVKAEMFDFCARFAPSSRDYRRSQLPRSGHLWTPPKFLNLPDIMDNRKALARSIARELASRPENKSVDSSWYCIAVIPFLLENNKFRLVLSHRQILDLEQSKFIRKQLKVVPQLKLELFIAESKN